MKIDLWFPTPVYTHLADEQQAQLIQSELAKVIDTEHQQILTQADAKARSYTQSRELEHRQVIQKYQLNHLHDFLLQQCSLFLSKLAPSIKHIEIRESWFNFYQPGDSQELHNHVHPIYPSFLSGSYYVEADENAGDLKFYHPNFNTAITADSQGLETIEATYPPIKNNLVLFRSHVSHAVMPNKSQSTRISISFNIYVAE